MASRKIEFQGSLKEKLAARLDLPNGEPRAYALFAHCFTCSKDIFAAARVAGELSALGIAVLRFDFTGLGHSDGEFANTNFSSNIGDLIAAAGYLRENHQAPAILIGHSLGGAAVLAAAGSIPEVRAVATIAAPSDPGHVSDNFSQALDEIEATGEAQVQLGGRPFTITKQFVQDISEQNVLAAVENLRCALLVLHGPRDETVNIDHAAAIFGAAKHPRSFISLDGADHLLTRRADAVYAARMISAWASRYVEGADIPAPKPAGIKGAVVVAETGAGPFTQAMNVDGRFELRADEPVSLGGADSGPTPYDFLLAGLGACTSMTIRMYADRKKLPLDTVSVTLAHEKIHAEDCAACATTEGRMDRITRDIGLTGDLTADERRKLIEIANKCPVHRTLESEVSIVTRESESAGA